MKWSLLLTTLLSLTTALPPQHPNQQPHDAALSLRSSPEHLDGSRYTDLEKRRGGGGGKGGGSSSSGGSSSGGRGGGASGRSYTSSSNLGGRTRDGSGTAPSYGGRYTGGAAVPYTSGAKSPTRGITPFLLPIGALAFFPALWLYPAYAYPYSGYGYQWSENGRNRTANVTCLCQEYSVCGCDPDNGNDTITAQQLTNGSGSGAPVNSTQVRVVDFGDANTTAYINGTLDNGTTASGGTDPSNENEESAAVRLLANYGGYWFAVAIVSYLVSM